MPEVRNSARVSSEMEVPPSVGKLKSMIQPIQKSAQCPPNLTLGVGVRRSEHWARPGVVSESMRLVG